MPKLPTCPRCDREAFLLIGAVAYCGTHAREANGGRL